MTTKVAVRSTCYGISGVALVVFALVFSHSAYAQKIDKSRRVVQNVKPDYPTSLRMAHVGGIVKLNVTVAPGGSVLKIELLGGNPIFAESAIKAVTKWKYAPAATETTNELEFHFNPDSPNTR